ncbi:MAG: hypothetical protein K0S90_1041, partial [Enterobacteriaceae bacterium]|nr:hypothetical protein [Enterobacteriaceae bacterium]
VYIVTIIHIILIITITCKGGVLAVWGINAPDIVKNQDDHNNEIALLLGTQPLFIDDASH